jgi:hypothetical protein
MPLPELCSPLRRVTGNHHLCVELLQTKRAAEIHSSDDWDAGIRLKVEQMVVVSHDQVGHPIARALQDAVVVRIGGYRMDCRSRSNHAGARDLRNAAYDSFKRLVLPPKSSRSILAISPMMAGDTISI